MKDSYLDYSMSVIVSRAIPDVRDGLKPVHRRVLFSMSELGLSYNKPYKKSARIVGECLGKYHPHGDTAVYDTIVRMAQDFSLRYPLVDGQGNFGSVDGDSAAAMRYTEARLSRIAEELLRDLEKNTVGYQPNFDDTLTMPTVLPSMVPNLLINGSSGIAVGMSTNIPPHNLKDTVDAVIAQIENPAITVDELTKILKAPDFPTGGIIYGYEGVKSAYETGRGSIKLRAKANIEVLQNNRENIIVSEIPYQVNKSNLLEKIADLVRNKKIEGISDLRDESDRDGMRMVIELKRDAIASVVLNQLFKHTQMQTTFGVIMLALVDGKPMVLNLKEMITPFIEHRHDIVLRRTQFELEAAEKRAHILEGLKIALENIDAVIETIKKSKDTQQARERLMEKFKLSEVQASEILKMQLQRLTALEVKKIENEYLELIKLIEKLKGILASKPKRMSIIKKELQEIKKTYYDDRRTEIVHDNKDISIEDIIAEEDMVVTISHQGFIKRFPVSGYRRQTRGGRGASGATAKDDDYIEHLFIASTHHYLLFFTNTGRCFWLKVYEIPQTGKASRGRHIDNLLKKSKDETIKAFVAVKEFDEEHFVVMATSKGIVKKTNLSAYGNPRKGGINAISLDDDDDLIEAKMTDGSQHIVLGTYNGLAIRFSETTVREMGRTARGVIGVRLEEDDRLIGMVVLKRNNAEILVVSEKGIGKRSSVADYRVTNRGGKGIITMKTTEKTGKMLAIREVIEEEDLMIITANGVVIRQNVGDIRLAGRNTQGVKLIKLDSGDQISDVTNIVMTGESDNGNDNGGE